MRTQTAILSMILAGATGASGALWLTSARIVEARANEAQANGLESQCKATLAQWADDAANDPNNPDNEQEEIVAPKVKLHEDYVRPQ